MIYDSKTGTVNVQANGTVNLRPRAGETEVTMSKEYWTRLLFSTSKGHTHEIKTQAGDHPAQKVSFVAVPFSSEDTPQYVL